MDVIQLIPGDSPAKHRYYGAVANLRFKKDIVEFITCSINTIFNPYNHNLSVKTIIELNEGMNDIAYEKDSEQGAINVYSFRKKEFIIFHFAMELFHALQQLF